MGWLKKYQDGGYVKAQEGLTKKSDIYSYIKKYKTDDGPRYYEGTSSDISTAMKMANFKNQTNSRDSIPVAPKRKGVRKNANGTESTHLMKAEKLNDSTWVGFPTLFQNKDESWKDMSETPNWMDAYEEAEKRGEVKNFGRDSIKALEYGKGSWKKLQNGGNIKDERYTSVKTKDNIPQYYKMEDKPMSEDLARNLSYQNLIKQTGEISQHEPQGWLSKFTDVATNPMTAFGYAARNERIPDNFTAGPRNATDYALDVINPAQYALDTKNLVQGVATGNIAQVGEGALGVIPLATEAKGLMKLGKSTLNEAKKVKKVFKDGAEEAYKVVKWNADPVKQLLTNKDARMSIPSKYLHPDVIERETMRGARTLDDALSDKLDLLRTPEGRKRLVAQEANYLWRNKVYGDNKEHILKQAEINADSRIFELEHIKVFGNKNKNALSEITKPGSQQIKWAKMKYGIPEYNAHYSHPEFWSGNDMFIPTPGKVDGKIVSVGGSQAPGKLALGHGLGKSRPTAEHEITHALQRGRIGSYDEVLNSIQPIGGKVSPMTKNSAEYFYGSPEERTPFLAELRQSMKERGLIKHDYDEITPDLLDKAYKSFSKKPNTDYIPHNSGRLLKTSNHRILDFMDPSTKNFEKVSKIMNKLPQVATPIVGSAAVAANSQKKNGGWIDKYQNGGVIEDDRGQWAHPGKVTKINSNEITMQGVDYPVLGISDTGDTKMMQPGEDYKFEGNNVTEYPQAKHGGGWIDKYQNGGTVSEIWQQKTGTGWADAKAQGLTDGSYDNNIKLLGDLNSGKYDKQETVTPINAPTEQKTPSGKSEFSGATFKDAFKQARETLGANRIFSYQGKSYGTNIAGEEFKPPEEDLKKFNMKPAVKQRVNEENKKVKSPFVSKEEVELEPTFKPWDVIKKEKEEINKMSQADIILKAKRKAKSKDNFVIIDKAKGLAHVYGPDSDEPIYSTAVDIGKEKGDAQTVTKINREEADVNKDGTISETEAARARADFSKGNKSTGAGRYTVSNLYPEGYKGQPLINLKNEEGQEVATSFHSGFVNDNDARVSNGCIRCNPKDLKYLLNNLNESDEVFVLPEDEGNSFIYENGKLNFNSQSNMDYDNYIDSKGNEQTGQGINRTRNTLNFQPIKIEFNEEAFEKEKFDWLDFNDQKELDNTVKPFISTLESSKKDIMKLAKINGDLYNEVAQVAFGILGVESDFGDTNTPATNVVKGVIKKLDPKKGSPDTGFESWWRKDKKDREWNSLGLTQVVWNQLSNEERTKLKKLNINTIDDFNNPIKAARGTALLLALRYNNEIKGKIEGDIQDLLSSRWNKGEGYADRVKHSNRFINLRQLD